VSTPEQQQKQQTPEEIRREIERTRQELGDTVDALSHKANVKEQARLKRDEVKEQARVKKDEVQERVSANPTPFLVIGGALALLLLIRMLRK
jgi:predicted AlkP superfamily phosphohydrolase/phosphomutase